MTTIFFICAVAIMTGAGFFAIFKWMEVNAVVYQLQTELANQCGVNPWRSQLMLMLKSEQEVSSCPQFNKTAMLYGALIIEESAETLVGLANAIDYWLSNNEGDLENSYKTETFDQVNNILVDYHHIAKVMALAAITIRNRLKQIPDEIEPLQLPLHIARELLDGCTDLHVVTAGLSLTTGLPGQAGYERVATSNLSKANPVTGMIDKDPSGKWIKGSAYQTPDLDSLFDRSYRYGVL